MWCWRSREIGRIIPGGFEYKLFDNFHIHIQKYDIKVVYKQIVGNRNPLHEHPCVYVILRPLYFNVDPVLVPNLRSEFPLLLLPLDTVLFLGAFVKLRKTILVSSCLSVHLPSDLHSIFINSRQEWRVFYMNTNVQLL